MTVGQRLYLMVLPGLFGVGLAGALAYWGEYNRQAPEVFVIIAGVVAVVSAGAAWYNARYIRRRLDQLAHARGGSALSRLLSPLTGADGPDALDTIEGSVAELGARVTTLARERDDARAAAVDEHVRLATLLATAARAGRAALDEARLPLHILVDAPFGELNDNQLELLADSRAAAERGDRALAQLEDAGALLSGHEQPRAERVSLTELLRGIEPQLRAAAVRSGVSVSLDIEPALPRVVGDRERVREALLALMFDAISAAASDHPLRISATITGGYPAVSIAPAGPVRSLEAQVALLALPALGADPARDGGALHIAFGHRS